MTVNKINNRINPVTQQRNDDGDLTVTYVIVVSWAWNNGE
jgi:hypothetical protein